LGAKATASDYRDAHGLKERITDGVHVFGSMVIVGVWLALGNEVIVRHIVRDICRPARRNSFHSRQCGKPLLQPLMQLHVFAWPIALYRRRNLEENEMVCAKSDID
jgi:hypothetical protein